MWRTCWRRFPGLRSRRRRRQTVRPRWTTRCIPYATSRGREVHPSVAFLIEERAALLLWGPHTTTLFPGLYALYMSAQPGAATLRTQSTVEQSWMEDKHAELPGSVPRGGRGAAGQGMSLLARWVGLCTYLDKCMERAQQSHSAGSLLLLLHTLCPVQAGIGLMS